jgi:hypothetical protein
MTLTKEDINNLVSALENRFPTKGDLFQLENKIIGGFSGTENRMNKFELNMLNEFKETKRELKEHMEREFVTRYQMETMKQELQEEFESRLEELELKFAQISRN